jgi:hypothetical protein
MAKTHPIIYDFQSMPRGDDFLGIHFFLFDANEAPIDLTGCTAKMQLRRTVGNVVVLEWKTDDNTIFVANNEVYIKERPGAVMDIPDFNYLYDIQVTYSDNFVDTILKGLFPIDADITR